MKIRIILLAITILATAALVGCPGNRQIDKDANEALWAWVMDKDTHGWEIDGFPGTNYKNVVVDHLFKPTRLQLVIKGDEVNPYHQRNMIEMIVREWRNKYPANLRPRFNLKVELYDLELNKDKNLGWTEIDTDGNVETHHSKTQDMI